MAAAIGAPSRAADAPAWWWWALLALCLALLSAWPLSLLPLHVSHNNNEGWNAYWATRAITGAPLYTGSASPITNNYPPLSFYVAGYAGWALGDMILAGRLIALAGLLACAGLIAVCVRRLGAALGIAAAAGALFLLYVATIAWRYIAADDPQWLAQALMLGALALLLDREGRMPRPGCIVAACLLMLGSGLVKHSQLALPLAATAWLAWHDRRGLAIWLGTAAFAGGLALALLAARFGAPFFGEVLHHERVFEPSFLRASLVTLSPLLPAAILALFLARGDRQDRQLHLLFLFAALALGIGIAERAGQGVAQNAHFDAAEALLMLAALAIARRVGPLETVRARTIALAALLLPALLVLPPRTVRLVHQLATRGKTAAAWKRAIVTVREQPGPVACERLALCYWSGKPQALDFFNYGQKLKRGHDPAGLGPAIAAQRFGALVRLADDRGRAGHERLTPALDRLIEQRYRVVQALPDNLYVLVPR